MDRITSAERRLIDEAIAEGRVRTVDARRPGRPVAGPSSTSLDERKKAAADRKRALLPGIRDRRRFKSGPVATGEYTKVADLDQAGTIFPTQVLEVSDGEPVLKDGKNSVKIGGDVLVGRLKGAKIFTLTLEERATCPRSCKHWGGCFGNGMQLARRWKHGPELVMRLAEEVSRLCQSHPRVLIRLHVLGDFWSFDYLRFWAEQLDYWDNLYVFGFTAWLPGTKIGDGIVRLRAALPERFMVRTSERTGEWGAFTVDFPTERRFLGDALVCPEQRDANAGGAKEVHCGSCGACWAGSRPIAFITH